jgi:polar amino acid transport system substrate-binding protein
MKQTDFANVISEALTSLIADGTYKTVLDKWGVAAGAITTPAVNPTVS